MGGAPDGLISAPLDGVVNFLPGYRGSQQILSTSSVQQLNIVVDGLAADAHIQFALANTTRLTGIASNANSAANTFASNATDDDFVLDADAADANANGRAIVGLRCRDFGGRTTVNVTIAGVQIASLSIPLDTDDDTLPDVWEDLYTTGLPSGFIGFDKTQAQSIKGTDDNKRDDDANTGANPPAPLRGDRFSSFDEYRGFLTIDDGNAHHIRTNPSIKDVFVFSPDKDPYIAQQNNADGFQENPANGQPMLIGSDAQNVPIAIHLLDDTQFVNQGAEPDGTNNSPKGDVNFNSPAPVGGAKQKRIWIATDISKNPWAGYGRSIKVAGKPGPNGIIESSPSGNNTVAAAWVYLTAIRSDVAFIDGDGWESVGPSFSSYIFGRRPANANAFSVPAGFPAVDANYQAAAANTIYAACPFRAEDQVVWWDRNDNNQWDRGDALWRSAAGNNIYNPQNDRVIIGPVAADGTFEAIPNNQQGVVLGANDEFRYVANFDNAGYQNGADIFTIRFNRAAYISARDFVIAHEGLGHPLEMQHLDANNANRDQDVMVDHIVITAEGLYDTSPNPPGPRLVNFPTNYSQANKNLTQLL